jgi:hypothetical protein
MSQQTHIKITALSFVCGMFTAQASVCFVEFKLLLNNIGIVQFLFFFSKEKSILTYHSMC